MKSKIILLAAGCFLLVNLFGCEAFVRKFTRKPNKEDLTREEMVLTPQEYQKPNLSKEEEYRQYLLYWKSWQDELIDSLAASTNHKKQLGCANEALSNLAQLRQLLNEETQKKLDFYINQLKELQAKIVKDIYGREISRHHYSAERIKMNILRLFSYPKIKDSLI
ncbi:MAG: hypothetical protein V2A59_03375 [Candidatus Omnitrophota bacterium]